jgi:choline dehydrogenase-like flavoprotein
MTIGSWTDPLGEELEVDAVVVGAGPGGSAVSRVLARAGWDVVLLEEGPPRSNFRPNYFHTARYHMQESGTMLAQGSVPLPVAAGRGIGGGSLVNSAICFRTPDHVLEEWSELLADDRYRPDAMRPLFDFMEERIQVVPVTEAIAGENNMIVARGVAALGLQGGLLRRNTPTCVGCGICNFGCPSGGKFSVDKNLIRDGLDAGLRIQADCRVERVLHEGGRAIGVVGRLHDTDTREPVGRITVRARRAVILSAGAIGTPRLLWTDGVAAELGPVGDTLFLHPGSAVLGRCDHEVHMWKGATQGAYVWSPDEPDVLPHTVSAPPEAFIALTGQVGHGAKQMLSDINHLCGLGVMVHDHGVGSVRATAEGRADIRYRWADEDVETLKRGMVLSARVLLAGGAKEVFATAHGATRHPDAESLGRELQGMKLADFSLYSAHPMGTMMMGTDRERFALDSRARAHRMQSLYVADASVFPTSLGVNPQLTTMVMGTLIGQGILEDLG